MEPAGAARQPMRAMKDRELATFPALSHGRGAIIKTLSPSDSEFDRFINGLTVLMPSVNETRRRAVDVQPNDISVVTWIEVGEIALLLGADLEQTNDPNRGGRRLLVPRQDPQERRKFSRYLTMGR